MSVESNAHMPAHNADKFRDTHPIQAGGDPTQELPTGMQDTKKFVRPIDPNRPDSVALVDAAAIREALGLSQQATETRAEPKPAKSEPVQSDSIETRRNPEQYARIFSPDMLQAGMELSSIIDRYLKQKTYPFGMGKKTTERMTERMLDLWATVLFETLKQDHLQIDIPTAKRKEVLHTIFVRDIGSTDVWNDEKLQDFIATYTDEIFNLAIAKKGI